MKIFITGIRGFFGSNLAGALEARGHQVRGSSSEGGNWPRIRIGEPVDAVVLGDAEVIVHCAHNFQPGALELNVLGARSILEAGKGRQQVFVSSCSARADAVSEYGISKYRIERLYLDAGGTVVRPGLVVGEGGSFGRSLRTIRRSRLIPLVDGGRDRVAVIGVADLSEAMANLIEGGRRGACNLFYESMPEMREIVKSILQAAGRRAWIVPVPFPAALAVVRMLETLGVRVPFDSGTLGMLKVNRICIHASDLTAVLTSPTPPFLL